MYIVLIILFFFFSSRRRHTRCSRDWSSDVCSSDLTFVPNGSPGHRSYMDRPNAASSRDAIGKDDRWHLEMKRRWVDPYNFYVQDSHWGRKLVREKGGNPLDNLFQRGVLVIEVYLTEQ